MRVARVTLARRPCAGREPTKLSARTVIAMRHGWMGPCLRRGDGKVWKLVHCHRNGLSPQRAPQPGRIDSELEHLAPTAHVERSPSLSRAAVETHARDCRCAACLDARPLRGLLDMSGNSYGVTKFQLRGVTGITCLMFSSCHLTQANTRFDERAAVRPAIPRFSRQQC